MALSALTFAQRLRGRQIELEDSITVRVRDIVPSSTNAVDLEIMRSSVSTMVDLALQALEQDEMQAPLHIPFEAAAHARSAARNDVGLDILLRCCAAGFVVLEQFVLLEFAAEGMTDLRPLRSIQAAHGALLDALIVVVSDEYLNEAHRLKRSSQQLRAARVRRLLAGELVDVTEDSYDLDYWHLGFVGTGPHVGSAIRGLARSMDCRLLDVPHGEQSVWAWLGGESRELVLKDARLLVTTRWRPGVSLALGEPAKGVAGWRLTHSQAQSALLVSLRQPQQFTRYGDVALVAPWLRNEQHARWLVNAYLSSLDTQTVSGTKLRETLRQFFATGRNATAAASALKVSRRAMRHRMALIEAALGPVLVSRQAELELALRLDSVLGLSPSYHCEKLADTGLQ